ncbi:Protein transport protein S9 plasma membrane t-SNARE [Elasticomyces elasticus]|nr:Protein transport protein S9 plasma membrane t-SNARE [Elasticomyces elasticus]
MPFGLPKRSKEPSNDTSEDSLRTSLFSRKSKPSSTPSAASVNPYAVNAPASDPYAKDPSALQQKADPYAQRNGSTLSQPPAYDGRGPSPGPAPGPRVRNEKSAVPLGGYGGAAQGGYGQAAAYGQTPYGDGGSQRGAGGYGGLGRRASQDTLATDAGRAELFGNAPARVQQQAPQQGGGAGGYGQGAGGVEGGGMPGGYGAYEDRQLTAEEEEEQDVAAAKGEIKFIKQQDVASTRNARRIAEMAQQTGMETLTRLGQQGERIHNTERNLDTADQHQLLAEDKARELRTLNRSMFAVHVSNPFTANKRREAADALALDKRQSERRILDATRAAAYDSTARQQSNARDLQGNAIRPSQTKASLADRAKYQFEADSEDDEMENEIDSNLDAIHRSAKTLNQLGRAMGDEIDSQNKHIDRIIDKTDRVDDKIAVNRARLDRIH